jgi:hypothetical protein
LGYRVILFLSALGGLLAAVLTQPSVGEDRITMPVYGAVGGSIASLCYKYSGFACCK